MDTTIPPLASIGIDIGKEVFRCDRPRVTFYQMLTGALPFTVGTP